jgi:hypothetical protein
MAELKNKGVHPLVAVAANVCCCCLIGYVLLGQAKKGLLVCLLAFAPVLIAMLLGAVLGPATAFFTLVLANLISVPWGGFFAVLAAIDAYQVAEAVQNGEPIDENGYKLEILHRIMVNVDKSAVLQG